MLGKLGILITILTLVLAFYFVISLGAGRFSKGETKPETKRYCSVWISVSFIYINYAIKDLQNSITVSLYANIIVKKTSQTINKNNQYNERALILFSSLL